MRTRFIFLKELKDFKTEYTWNQINCFTKPFAIGMHYFSKEYLIYFLFDNAIFHCFSGVYTVKDIALRNQHFVEFFNKELEQLYGVRFKEIACRTGSRFAHKIAKELMEGNPVILPSDLYYLPYCENFLIKHHPHYLLIKGIDIERKLFFVLDNMHIEKGAYTKYEDFTLTFNQVLEMFLGYSRYLGNRNYCFWSLNQTRQKDDSFEENHINYYKKLYCNFVERKVKKNYFEDDILKNKISVNTMDYLENCKYRILYFKQLDFLSKQGVLKIESEMIQENLERWERLKYITVNCIMHNYLDISYVSDEFDKAKKYDMELDKLIMDKLSVSEKKTTLATKNEQIQYILKGQTNSICIDKQISIMLFEDKEYDMWLTKNDAPQVYFNEREEATSCEIEMSVDTDDYAPCQSGILVECACEEFYLIGVCGKINFEILAPHCKERYLLHRFYVGNLENYKIKVLKAEDDKLSVELLINEKWIQVEVFKTISEVKRFGVFSRSWEKCECRTVFHDIHIGNEKVT